MYIDKQYLPAGPVETAPLLYKPIKRLDADYFHDLPQQE
jgi:hypothetical protein